MNTSIRNKIIVLSVLLSCTALSSYAQKEAYNWVMNTNCAMTWNTTQTIGGLSGLPTPISTTATFSGIEGVLSMSDAAGNLLFYSDGIWLWNASHAQMNSTVLTGHNSSAQSGIVIPYPGQANKYIVFTIGMYDTNNLSYTIVDMTLNGGLGGITEQNTQLTGALGTLCESVSAVRHANGTDYWIVAPGKGAGTASSMNVWSVTSAGVQIACIASYQLPANTVASPGANGYLRFSTDGTRFAWVEHASDKVFFGQFNPSTGVCSNIKYYNGSTLEYGVEFSPDGKILYVSRETNFTMRVYKFDDLLAAADPNLVTYKSETFTGTGAVEVGALQTGPDGRIYGALYTSTNLLVISNPNDYDNYTWTVVSGLVSGTVRLGLPNFLAEYFEETVIANTDTVPFVFSEIPKKVDVLANDSLDDCTHASITLDVITYPQHGNASVNAQNLIEYTSVASFAGRDSLQYRITCDADKDSAWVYLMVYESPDNITDATCYIPPIPTDWSFNSVPQNIGENLLNFAPVYAGDLDGDNLPELVSFGTEITVTNNGVGTWGAANIYIHMGSDQSQRTIARQVSLSGGVVAMGRVRLDDDSYKSLIFVACATSPYLLYAYSLDNLTTPFWTSAATYTNGNSYVSQSIGLVDFNHDGFAELYINNSIFDAATGTLMGRAPTGYNQGISAGHTGNHQFTLTTAVDVDGDGDPELLAGNQTFKVAITRTSSVKTAAVSPDKTVTSPFTGVNDGHTQVADFDLDGMPDIVVSRVEGTTSYIYIWNPRTQTVMASVSRAMGMNGRGTPFIGDIDFIIDSLGVPEIIILADKLVAYKYNGTTTLQQFWEVNHTDTSYGTGMTLFDFNQDGTQEIVYRDVTSLEDY